MNRRRFATIAALFLIPALACATLIGMSGARCFNCSIGGGGDEFVGSWTNFDLVAHPIYRVDMSAQDYPTFLTAGATHTYEATGAWDGGPCAKLTPPISGGTDGYSALGAFEMNDGATLAVQRLSIRWEAALGSGFVDNWPVSADMKWVIVNTQPALGDSSDDFRPMANWQVPDEGGAPQVFGLAVAAGTFKQFNPNPPPDDLGPDGHSDFYYGSTSGTYLTKPILAANTWLTFEMQIIAVADGTHPNGLVRIVVTDRTGATLTDIDIDWTYDEDWYLPRYISQVQVIGGFFNVIYPSSDANTYQRIAGVTFAKDHVGLLGPRAGFVQ